MQGAVIFQSGSSAEFVLPVLEPSFSFYFAKHVILDRPVNLVCLSGYAYILLHSFSSGTVAGFLTTAKLALYVIDTTSYKL